MTEKVLEYYRKAKTFSQEEYEELFRLFCDDPQLREDLIDIALIREAEAESMEYVTLDELKAGKRTYDD